MCAFLYLVGVLHMYVVDLGEQTTCPGYHTLREKLSLLLHTLNGIKLALLVINLYDISILSSKQWETLSENTLPLSITINWRKALHKEINQ